MSRQMTEDWIEQEYHRWKKMPCYNPFGLDEQMEWIAKAFALHILKTTSKDTIAKEVEK